MSTLLVVGDCSNRWSRRCSAKPWGRVATRSVTTARRNELSMVLLNMQIPVPLEDWTQIEMDREIRHVGRTIAALSAAKICPRVLTDCPRSGFLASVPIERSLGREAVSTVAAMPRALETLRKNEPNDRLCLRGCGRIRPSARNEPNRRARHRIVKEPERAESPCCEVEVFSGAAPCQRTSHAREKRAGGSATSQREHSTQSPSCTIERNSRHGRKSAQLALEILYAIISQAARRNQGSGCGG